MDFASNTELRKSQQVALAQIRKASLSPYNRLHSIYEDSRFVNTVRDAYSNFPVIPNLRCGAWYTNPEFSSSHDAYFKSADGHYNAWSFNLRRPNLHLLPVIQNHRGIILVDSTRSGKRIPDALSKTVPIWCAVVNRAVKLRKLRIPNQHPSSLVAHKETSSANGNRDKNDDDDEGSAGTLYTPPQCVSPQEHAQIERRIDTWAEEFCNSSYELPLDLKPLRPIWITPSTTSFPFASSNLASPNSDNALSNHRNEPPFHPIICVSASKIVAEGLERRTRGYSYVQGSGDDHEAWSEGLTPKLFWRHIDELLGCDEDEVSSVIRRIVSDAKVKASVQGRHDGYDIDVGAVLRKATPIARVGGLLAIAEGHIGDEEQSMMDGGEDCVNEDIAVIIVSSTPVPVSPSELADSHQDNVITHSRHLHIIIPSDKKNNIQNTAFTSALGPVLDFVGKHLSAGRRVCVVCDAETRDSAVGLVVAASQRWFGEDGEFRGDDLSRDCGEGIILSTSDTPITKDTIRIRLQWTIASYPAANPSRATLKRINEYFLSERRFRNERMVRWPGGAGDVSPLAS